MPYHEQPQRPRRLPPPGACDTHFHVFDEGPGHTADPASAYQPTHAPMPALLHMHEMLGIIRGILVQPTAVLIDYDAFIAQLATAPQFRGVAVIDASTTDQDLLRLSEAGVCGVRFHFARFLNKRPEIPWFLGQVDRLREMGWHVDLHVEAEDLSELAPVIQRLSVPVVIDHMSHMRISRGVDQPGMQVLLDLLKHDHCWVKYSNCDRWSPEGPPHYQDAIPFGRRVLECAPGRVLWGTDWPHVMYRDPRRPGDPPPQDADLLNLLASTVNSEREWRQVLVENPQRLYGFPALEPAAVS
ncbi:MAG: amidohydrolase [Pigmentiphaga sp.]